MAIPKLPSVKEMVEAGVHFGHASGHWHPKMAPYIFCTRDKLHILDLEQTKSQLETVLPVLEEKVRSGKSVILVGTKKQVAPIVKEIGDTLNIPYINERWLGGTLTNFGQMMQSIARMKRIEELLASDEVKKLIKKERVMMQGELKRMEARFGGLKNYVKKPDLLVVVDLKHEHNAVKEARNQGVQIMAVIDTDSNPHLADYVIPANDDGPKSVRLILDLIAKTIAEGQKLISVAAENKTKSETKSEEVVSKVAEKVVEAQEAEIEAVKEMIDETEAAELINTEDALAEKAEAQEKVAKQAKDERELKKELKETEKAKESK